MGFVACRSIVRSWWALGACRLALFADLNSGVGYELVGRNREVQRRRPATDAAGAVVLRAMARTEPAVVVALVRERNAAEMRANTDQHQPLIVVRLDARLIRLRIGKSGHIDGA